MIVIIFNLLSDFLSTAFNNINVTIGSTLKIDIQDLL